MQEFYCTSHPKPIDTSTYLGTMCVPKFARDEAMIDVTYTGWNGWDKEIDWVGCDIWCDWWFLLLLFSLDINDPASEQNSIYVTESSEVELLQFVSKWLQYWLS
jgi:hypothetical protein